LAIAWLGWCGAPAAAQSLKVPFAALSPNYAPLWIADQAGLFKKHGLDVQLIYISAGSVIVPAILSGQVDIANMSSAPALTAWARGAELTAVGVTSNRLLHVIMTRSSIKKPEELKGKKIGGDRYGSLSDLILREALRYYNLVPDRDVAVIQTGGLPERLGALKVGAVDGAIVTGDTALEAEKLGFHKVIDLGQLPIRYPSSTITSAKPFLPPARDGKTLSARLDRGHQDRQDRQRTHRLGDAKVSQEQRSIGARQDLRDLPNRPRKSSDTGSQIDGCRSEATHCHRPPDQPAQGRRIHRPEPNRRARERRLYR
jgi:ABC-type amino acid transport substrate-binding protein